MVHHVTNLAAVKKLPQLTRQQSLLTNHIILEVEHGRSYY